MSNVTRLETKTKFKSQELLEKCLKLISNEVVYEYRGISIRTKEVPYGILFSKDREGIWSGLAETRDQGSREVWSLMRRIEVKYKQVAIAQSLAKNRYHSSVKIDEPEKVLVYARRY